jgi:Uma2 family endonuclease
MLKAEYIAGYPASEVDQNSDYETERGKPMPNRIHGTLQSIINMLLSAAYKSRFHFPNETALATNPPTTPDICVYPKKKLDVRTIEAKTSEMPLTTIEILSPTQTIEELQDKAWDVYFPAGIGSAWIVIPELKVIQLLLPDGEPQIFHKNTLKDPSTGIEISLLEVFEDLL